MKKEDLFNALSDIDENLIARAKEAEEVFAEPKQFIAAKKGFSWKIPAAACVALAGVAATIVAVMINQGGTLPYDPNSTNPSGSEITSAPDTSYIETEATTDSYDITEAPGGHHDRIPEEYDDLYPMAAVYEYDGDLSEVTAIYPEIDIKLYSDYDELAGESDIVVMGTFMDNTRQDVDPNGLYNGSSIYSYNRFRIEKILKGENIVSEGEDIIIGESYGVFNNRLSAYTLLTPMIKGDSWVYFLSKTDFGGGKTLYYTVGDYQGRYAAPDRENFPLPANWDITERNISDGNNIYSAICTLLGKHDGTDREPFEAEYPEGLYPYTGDYSEITDADVPKNLAEGRTQYYTYEELEKASDAVVIGTFIDCPHQNVDPVPDEGPFGVAITSYNKFRVECVLSLGSTTDIKVGDVVIIQQVIGVYGNELMSVSGLTPMIKGDSWVYFLRGNDGVFTAAGDSDGRYPPLGRTPNTKLPFYDNDLGVTDMAAFKQDIYDTLKQKLTVSEPVAEPSHPTAQSEADIDAYLADLYPYTGDYFEIDDYPDTAYHAFDNVKRYSTYAETASASDIVVMGTFVSDPYQYIDPSKNQNALFFISYGKFKVEKVLKSDGSVNEGDIILVSQHTAVCGEKLKSSYGLTPIINGDSWVYFLTGHGGFYTVQEPDRRYPVPGRTNTKLPSCNNKKGVYHESWFNDDIYGVINEKLNPQLTETVKVISGQSLDAGFDFTKSGYFDISEYEDIYFHYNYEKVEAVIDGVSHQLYSGMPIVNVYLCDLNGDGKREICSAVYMGSGMIDSRLYAYDVANDTLYQLENRGNYDYSIDIARTALSSGKSLIYDITTYDGGELVSYDKLRISDMEVVPNENPNTD